MNDSTTPGPLTEPTWLPIPDVADALGVPLRQVRTLIEDRALLALSRGPRSVRCVPAEFLLPPEHPKGPGTLGSLRGTIMLLGDAGLSEQEIVDWLFGDLPELGGSPIAALQAGRTRSVRRIAQTLG